MKISQVLVGFVAFAIFVIAFFGGLFRNGFLPMSWFANFPRWFQLMVGICMAFCFICGCVSYWFTYQARRYKNSQSKSRNAKNSAPE